MLVVMEAMEEVEDEWGAAPAAVPALATADGTVTSGGTRLRFEMGLADKEIDTTSVCPFWCCEESAVAMW